MSTENIDDSASEKAMAATFLDSGGTAFPADMRGDLDATGRWFPHSSTGMTLRDWFAGQALAGWIADPQANVWSKQDEVAEGCYKLADAMLKARKEQR